MSRLMFGGFLALVLLAIYVGGVFEALFLLIGECRDGTCSVSVAAGVGTKDTIITTIGALISAVVVAALSTSEPGQPVLQRQIKHAAPHQQTLVRWAVTLYLLAWLITGLSALVVACLVYPDANGFLAHIGLTWFGTAIAAGYAFFGLKPITGAERSLESKRSERDVNAELRAQIRANKIKFDSPALQTELLGNAVSEKVKELVVFLAMTVPSFVKISNILRTSGNSHHVNGMAVDIGNEDVAADLLSTVATQANVDDYGINEIIFDAGVAGETNRNKWNFDEGRPHRYSVAELDAHKNHIHFAVS